MKTSSFRKISIGDLGHVVTGKTPPSARPELFGTDYPFLTPTDIDGINRHIEAGRYLSQAGHDFQPRLLLPERSICVVCIGATIGKVCMTSRPSFTNQQINTIVVDEESNDPFFVYHLLTTIKDLLKGNAGGAATPIINKSAFSEMEVFVPPLTTQRKIAAILSAYDDLIENNLRRIKILEEMARSLYREWFVNFRFPGHQKVRMVNSPLGKIPEGWEPAMLGALADEKRESVDPNEVDASTPYFGLEHLPRRSVALMEWGSASDVASSKLRVKKDQILFGKIRPYFHKVGPSPIDAICSSDIIVLAVRRPEVSFIVLGCVSSVEFVAHATQTSKGTKMPRADWHLLSRYGVAVPPSKLLKRYNEAMESSFRAIQNHVFRVINLRQTRDLLLPKLISGDLDVSDLDIKIRERSA